MAKAASNQTTSSSTGNQQTSVSAARAATRRIEATISGRSPDEFQAGRWPYDQEQGNRGTIVKMRSLAFRWPNSKTQQHYVFVRLWVRPEGEDRLATINYQAAWLPKFDPNNRERLVNGHVPTRDSVDEQFPLPACPDEFEGDVWSFYEAAGDKEDVTGLDYSDMTEEELESWSGYSITGKGPLPKMDFTQLMESFAASGYENWPVDDYRDLEGLDCHFVYVRPKYGMKKKAKADGGETVAAGGSADQKDNEFLLPVVADIFNLPGQEGDQAGQKQESTTASKGTNGKDTTGSAGKSSVTASAASNVQVGSPVGGKKKSTLVISDEVQEAVREIVYKLVTEAEDEIIDIQKLSTEAMLAMGQDKQPEVFQLLTGQTLSTEFWASMPLVRKTKAGKVSLSDAGRERYEAESEQT